MKPIDTPFDAHTVHLTSLGVIRRVWRDYLRAQKSLLGLALISALFAALTTSLGIGWLQPSIDLMFRQTTQVHAYRGPFADWIVSHPFLSVPGIFLAITLARLVAQLGMATSVNRLGHDLVGRVQSQLFSKLVHADLAYLHKHHSGQYLSSVLYDSGLLREAATNGTINYAYNSLVIIGCLLGMFSADWQLTLGVLVSGPIISLVLSAYNRRTKKAAQGAMDETSALSTAVLESLDGVKIVKIANQEDAEIRRVDAVIARRQSHIIKGANARASAAPATEALTQTILALVIVYAGWRSQSGAMSLGSFMLFISALMAAGQSLRQVANLQTVMAEGFTAARRLFTALDIAPEIANDPNGKTLSPQFKQIEFDSVRFGYEAEAEVLKGVSFTVKAGQSVALVGPSGSGKSSLMNLLPRFFDLKGGHIRFDTVDHRDFSLKSLRRQIALVTQEPLLFDDTIAANIAYGKPDATQIDIETAALDAGVHDFIISLPQAYDTRVGEAGSRLSGGQKQRIAIARAFLKNAPLLLLDEATSALDTQSEGVIQEALERLMKGRTTIVIAHRLSTIRHADLILVLKEGHIHERGTHDTLMAAKGLYADLAQVQMGPASITNQAGRV